MRYCLLCRKKEARGNGTFFFVPQDKRIKEKWSKICQKEITKTTKICIDHFSKEDIIAAGGRMLLMPKAVPIVQKENDTIHTSRMPIDGSGLPCAVDMVQPETPKQGLRFFTIEELTGTAASKYQEELQKEMECQIEKNINVAVPKDIIVENSKEVLNLNNNVMPPQLQEEPIMQIPVIKSVSYTGSTQTNTRLCGLVEGSCYSDEFRFNCFYCCEVFPLEQWKKFVDHLKEKHSEIKEPFKIFKYASDDHDYTPINLLPSTPGEAAIENVIKADPRPILDDPLEPTDNPFESVVLNPTIYYAQDEKKSVSDNINILNNFVETDSSTLAVSGMENKLGNSKKESKFCSVNKHKTKNNSKQTPITASSRCLKMTNNIEVMNTEDNEEYKPVSMEIVQQKFTEITFEYTPRDIVELLLNSMKNYPVLWQYDYEPFNEDFYEAVEDVCKIINESWSLKIDNLKMRRSINRIIRFYCCLFPNANVENVDKFTNYYDICAGFLPSSVNEIAYARCSHCYICYGNDFDLKRHLLEEQKYLQWPYACAQCKECFRDHDEFELHKLLPHYDEIFRCKLCNKRFELRSKYYKHMSKYHPQHRNDRGVYKCDICAKTFQFKYNLRYHKIIHGERQYKCHLCPKSYFFNAQLKLHLKIHRKEYDFICEVCGKEFLVQSNLTQHMKKHTGAKVTCNICNLKLRKSSLNRHLRLVHVAYEGTVESTFRAKYFHYNTSSRQRKRQLRPKKKGEGRKYQCKICKVSFEDYKLIVEHNKELHSDIPKLPCKICSAEFKHRIYLNRHYREKHNVPVIQAFKLIHQNQDLNVVLGELAEHQDASRNKPDNITKRNIETPEKSDLLPDDIFFEAEKMHSSTLQDEIMKAEDVITKQEIEIDDMTDLLTDILKEQRRNLYSF